MRPRAALATSGVALSRLLLTENKYTPFSESVLGAENQVRTGDPTIFSRVLYQLSYLGVFAARFRSQSVAYFTRFF